MKITDQHPINISASQDVDPAYISPKIRQRLGVPLEAQRSSSMGAGPLKWALLWVYYGSTMVYFPPKMALFLGKIMIVTADRWSCLKRCKLQQRRQAIHEEPLGLLPDRSTGKVSRDWCAGLGSAQTIVKHLSLFIDPSSKSSFSVSTWSTGI